MEVNAVFEGGGIKAIGLIGAVQVAEQRGIRFHRVAGTSSGAIVAALIAAGYSAEEIGSLLLKTPFKEFVKNSWFEHVKIVGPAFQILIKKGLYSGERLEQWIRNLLKAKGIRTFGDIPDGKLRIIASDISQGKLLVLPEDIEQYGMNPKKLEIAKAIRMSTSIPYFFEPVIIRKPPGQVSPLMPFKKQLIYIVDGGILSNFPLWLFDRETYEKGHKKTVPTLGFQLVGRQSGVPRKINGPFSMFHALFSTMMEAHDERYIEEHNRFRTIKIPTLGIRTTQFDISKEDSKRLYNSGFEAATKFFYRWSFSQYLEDYKTYVAGNK
jgi:NTE family protein